jgi:hypothetical protein
MYSLCSTLSCSKIHHEKWVNIAAISLQSAQASAQHVVFTLAHKPVDSIA